MNSRIPTSLGPEDLRDRVSEALRSVRQSYKGRSWPTVSHIVDAMNATAKRYAGQVEALPDRAEMDDLQLAAKRMNDGEAVGDGWIYGRNAVALEASGLVDADTMRKYRSALYFKAKNALGDDLAKSAEARWLKRHEDARAL